MTKVLAADSTAIAQAADVLQRGGLVAFPTETVYGLGANALDSAAVARIFAAKVRPATNPIIVHIADVADLGAVAESWPDAATRLAERFWPGSLTLVLLKRPTIPDSVTAGGPTVGVRVPAHPVALELLRAARIPIAAPSANRSTRLSPTTAQHVFQNLNDRIDLILDGGPCPGGIESTVLDMTASPPRILRPGLITPLLIEELIGPIQRSEPTPRRGDIARSPGMQAKHYAPKALLELAADDGSTRVVELAASGNRVGWLTWPSAPEIAGVAKVELPREPASYAAGLYSALHKLDAAGVDRIVVTRIPDDENWLAIADRLRRASST